MNSTWNILALLAIVIALLFIYPEHVKTILGNKLYTLGAFLVIFLIGFAISIKLNQR